MFIAGLPAPPDAAFVDRGVEDTRLWQLAVEGDEFIEEHPRDCLEWLDRVKGFVPGLGVGLRLYCFVGVKIGYYLFWGHSD
jgi:hypothetical protein